MGKVNTYVGNNLCFKKERKQEKSFNCMLMIINTHIHLRKYPKTIVVEKLRGRVADLIEDVRPHVFGK